MVPLQDGIVQDVESTRAQLDMDGASAGCYCAGFQQYKGTA